MKFFLLLTLFPILSFAALGFKDLTKKRQKEFLELSRWKSYPRVKRHGGDRIHYTVYKNENVSGKRKITPDSRNSIEEFYSINFDKFQNDDEYSCRVPTLNKFFNSLMGQNKTCNNTEIPFFMNNDRTVIRKIDKKRVYQIHYFFAGEGSAMMSRWGHAMLRYIVCAPERQAVGPECMNDIDHHVVLNYRANVMELTIDNIAGLTGKYPSQVLYSTMAELLHEYNIIELRDLTSLPLNINKEEQDFLLDVLNEEFWAYVGSYKFFTKNCATELADVLNLVFKNHDEGRMSVLSPLGLYEELIENNYIDDSVLEDKYAQAKGYQFKSKKNWFEPAIEKLQAFEEFDSSLEEWLESTSIEGRRAKFEELISLYPEQEATIRRNIFLLEAQAEKVFVQKYQEFVNHLAANSIKLDGAESIVAAIEGALKEKKKWRTPADLILGTGYGIPQSDELVLKQNIKSQKEAKKQITTSEFFVKAAESVHQIKLNIAYFRP